MIRGADWAGNKVTFYFMKPYASGLSIEVRSPNLTRLWHYFQSLLVIMCCWHQSFENGLNFTERPNTKSD